MVHTIAVNAPKHKIVRYAHNLLAFIAVLGQGQKEQEEKEEEQPNNLPVVSEISTSFLSNHLIS